MDNDLIAQVFPYNDKPGGPTFALDAILDSANTSRFVGPRLSFPQPKPRRSRCSRSPTAEPTEEGNDDDGLGYSPHLELRFSHGPRTGTGFIFGTDPDTCDVFLPAVQGISQHHFALTFENNFADSAEYRLVLRDFSTFGSAVTYDGHGRHFRRNFRWILNGHETLTRNTNIVIEICAKLKLLIRIPYPESLVCRDKISQFLQGTAGPEALFGALDVLNHPDTEPPSGSRTPGTGPILIRHRELGQGSYGVVTHLWDVSSAAQYALKEPTKRAIEEKKVNIKNWMREAKLLGRVSHDHIVRIFHAEYEPWPQLRLEYIPGGALEGYKDISAHERLEILRQSLSALVYLHGRDPPLVHRDIKLDNILVQSRDESSIHVKLTDFDLSKESNDLKTWCGTQPFLAPEIYDFLKEPPLREKTSYTPAVDVWSLGVVILRHARGIPAGDPNAGTIWCRNIVRKLKRDLEEAPNDLLQFLAAYMVIMKPELRASAHDCYTRALQLSAPTEDRSQTPTPSSFANRRRKADGTSPSGEGGDWSDDGDRAPPSSEGQLSIRADGPLPSSVPIMTRKRATRTSSSPSSGGTRRAKRREQSPVADASQPTVAGVQYGHENWLQDPLFVGSSIADLGNEQSDWIKKTTTSNQSVPRIVPELGGDQLEEESEFVLQDWLEQPEAFPPRGDQRDTRNQSEALIAAELLQATREGDGDDG